MCAQLGVRTTGNVSAGQSRLNDLWRKPSRAVEIGAAPRLPDSLNREIDSECAIAHLSSLPRRRPIAAAGSHTCIVYINSMSREDVWHSDAMADVHVRGSVVAGSVSHTTQSVS